LTCLGLIAGAVSLASLLWLLVTLKSLLG